jgi:hypothetical protein
LDQQHIGEFLKLLSDTTSNTQQGTTKVGATLFFREHVISIIKSVDPNTHKSYWNVIDSLPGMVQKGKRMFRFGKFEGRIDDVRVTQIVSRQLHLYQSPSLEC